MATMNTDLDSMTLYFDDMNHDILTKDEEVALGMKIKYGTKKEKKAAIDDLVVHNLKLVVSVARSYTNRGLELADLIQEGNVGLMKAAKMYDVELGNKFSTYATWWIRQSILRGIADTGSPIRIPVHMHERIRAIKKAEYQFLLENGEEGSDEEIAKMTGMTEEDVATARQAVPGTLSMDQPVDEENETTVGFFVEDDEDSRPEAIYEQKALHEDLEKVLSTLSPRNADIIRARYGLITGEPMTLEAVGQMYGITRERVRQVEAKAFKTIKNSPKRREFLQSYLYN